MNDKNRKAMFAKKEKAYSNFLGLRQEKLKRKNYWKSDEMYADSRKASSMARELVKLKGEMNKIE